MSSHRWTQVWRFYMRTPISHSSFMFKLIKCFSPRSYEGNFIPLALLPGQSVLYKPQPRIGSLHSFHHSHPPARLLCVLSSHLSDLWSSSPACTQSDRQEAGMMQCNAAQTLTGFISSAPATHWISPRRFRDIFNLFGLYALHWAINRITVACKTSPESPGGEGTEGYYDMLVLLPCQRCMVTWLTAHMSTRGGGSLANWWLFTRLHFQPSLV